MHPTRVAISLVLTVVLGTMRAASDEFDRLGKLSDPLVSVFDFTISVRQKHTEAVRELGIRTDPMVLQFVAESTANVPARRGSRWIHVAVTEGPGLIDVAVLGESAQRVSSSTNRGPGVPERIFQFEVTSLAFPPDGRIPVRIRFQDATVRLELTSPNGKGLELRTVTGSYATVGEGRLTEFANVQAREGQRLWQCTTLTISSATTDFQWSTDIPMQGLPKSLAVLDNAVFVSTTDGHSFYVCKDGGQLIYYDRKELPGLDPVDDLIASWRTEMSTTWDNSNDPTKERGRLTRFIVAAVMLDDERFVPCLIESIDKGRGLQEKMLAVAALEKYSGNSEAWVPPGTPTSRRDQEITMSRVFPEKNARSEQAKWRQIFAERTDHGTGPWSKPPPQPRAHASRSTVLASNVDLDPWDANHFSVSPDQKSIAYLSDRTIWMCDVLAGPPVPLVELPQRPDRLAPLLHLAWTPSQDGVVYAIRERWDQNTQLAIHRVMHASTEGVVTPVATIVREQGMTPYQLHGFHVTADRKHLVAWESTPLIWNCVDNKPQVTSYDDLVPSSTSQRYLGIEMDTRQLVIVDENFAVTKRTDLTMDAGHEMELHWSADEQFAVYRTVPPFESRQQVRFRLDLETGVRRRLNGEPGWIAFTGRKGELVQLSPFAVAVSTGQVISLSILANGDAPPHNIAQSLSARNYQRYPLPRHNSDFTLFAIALTRTEDSPEYVYHLVDRDGNRWPIAPKGDPFESYHVLAFADDDKSILAYGESQMISIPVRQARDQKALER